MYIYVCVCIYVCTHTHTPPMDERIYGYVGWDISLIQTGVRIQPHHAVSALQLPAGVHSCWALTICQGSIEACTLFPFSCPSMPRFPQGGAHCGLQPTSRSRWGGARSLCGAGAGCQKQTLGYRGCTCAVKEKRPQKQAQGQHRTSATA